MIYLDASLKSYESVGDVKMRRGEIFEDSRSSERSRTFPASFSVSFCPRPPTLHLQSKKIIDFPFLSFFKSPLLTSSLHSSPAPVAAPANRTMKFTLAAFTAILAPAAATVYFKEQFNDDVSYAS